MRFASPRALVLALAALTLGVLSACTAVVVEDPGPYPGPGYRPGPGPRVCARNYDPVCAARGGSVRTFGNDCQAEDAGYRVLRSGECGRDRPDRPPPVAQGCPRNFDPVCGQRRGRQQTFANDCLAEEAGFRVVRGGSCREDTADNGRPTICTRDYSPVCARRGGSVRTFGNECEARSADYRIVGDGPC